MLRTILSREGARQIHPGISSTQEMLDSDWRRKCSRNPCQNPSLHLLYAQRIDLRTLSTFLHFYDRKTPEIRI